ncbi:unnamed protein product [Urochloa decumbens]|uniref:Rx N-terminal domain-containing protein n=2 Tax=Urochloa decumbens TaxID=240449 RepID=A0ABC9DAW6_9POAL
MSLNREGTLHVIESIMAQIISSVVIQETVSKILSGLTQKHREGEEESNAYRNLERLEMAHFRLEAALETSDKWQITHSSLLRWRRKLRHAAQECDETLHKCKKRILEEEQMEHEVRNSSLPNRIVHTTKSFVSSVFNHDKRELTRSVVQRFEWFADCATEFFRFIELGGTPRRYMPFYSLVNNLFAGKELYHEIVRGNGYPSFLLWLVPFSTADHGIETSLIFIQKDGTLRKGYVYFSIILQISESTDIVGIAIKCLELFAPHFNCAVEDMRKELTQLPTQDFSWVPYIYSSMKEHWDNLQILGSQWFRPNPLCCKQHNQHELRRASNLDMAGLRHEFLEPVIEVNLQCQVSLSLYSRQNISLSEDLISLKDSPYLKAGITFAPHGSSEDMLPMNARMVRKEEHCLHTDVTLEQLEEIMLPGAINYFRQNAEAAVYQIIWKSKHGCALIQVEKARMSRQRTSMQTRDISGGDRKRKMLQRQHQELGNRTRMISHLLDIWSAHVPVRLQRLSIEWMKKEKESLLAAH